MGKFSIAPDIGKTLLFAMLAAIFLYSSSPSLSQSVDATLSDPSHLLSYGVFDVVSVVDGDTLTLADGREVRLTGIQAPKLPLGRRNFTAWPLAADSKRTLERLVSGRSVQLYTDGNGQDRYRRILAHVVRSDGLWIQGNMIERGLARVYTFPDNHRLAEALLARERTARQAAKGIWALPYYAIRSTDPAPLTNDVGTFQLLSGTVVDVAKVRSRTYLNFGEDYRSDFTISIDRKASPLFDAAGFDLDSLKGRSILVRGWVKNFNGPLIDVTHPEQIEILP